MAFVNGLYLEVTDRGQMYTSENLSSWTRIDSPTTNALLSIATFNGKIIVAGENGTVLQGDLTAGFNRISLGTTNWLEGVVASSNLLVAVGDNAAIYTSSDGTSWQKRPAPALFTNWLRSVAYGGGVFVTVGEGGGIATSTNGITWQARSSGTTASLDKAAWLDSMFYVVGDSDGTSATVLSSPSGSKWLRLTSGATNELFAAASANSSLLVVGDGEVRSSREGSLSLWINEFASAPGRTSPPPVATYYAALGDSNHFVIGGRSGVVAEGIQANPLGTWSWRCFGKSVRTWLWDVTRLPDLYVAVGDLATVMTSDDGIDWFEELVPSSVTNTVFLGVGGATNLALAVGSGGSIIVSPYALTTIVSTNTVGTNVVITTNLVNTMGLVWYPVEPRPTTNDLQGVAVGSDRLVVTGGAGTILTSTNGTNWSVRSAPTTAFLSSVESFPGGWVAVGDNGTLLFSSDTAKWTLQPSGTTNWVYRVRYRAGRLMAVGQGGTILSSTNGLEWTPQTSGTTRWLNDVALVDGASFAVGNQGIVLASTNGISWMSIGAITDNALFAAASYQGQLLTVGTAGCILRAQIVPQLDPIGIRDYAHTVTNSLAQDLFLLVGKPDQRFTLDSSTAFTDWKAGPTLEFTDSSGTLLFLQTSANLHVNQYFRATLIP